MIEQDNRLLMDRLGEAMSHKNIDNELKAKPFVSYIELQRKKDMVRVTRENRRLLQRIQTTHPSYNHIQWEQDAEKRMHYLRTMTQFPDCFKPPGVHDPEYKSSRRVEEEKKTSRLNEIHSISMDALAAEFEAMGMSLPTSGSPPQELMDSHGTRPNRPFVLPPIDR